MAVKYMVPYQGEIRGVDLRTGQRCLNVLYFKTDKSLVVPEPAWGAPLVGSSMTTFVNSLRSVWRDNILPRLSTHLWIQEYRVKEITGWLLDPTFRVTYGEQATALGDSVLDRGGAAGEAVPTNVAVSVQKITDRAGKSFRGGMRLSPIPESQQSNGTLTVTNSMLWQDAMNLYYTSPIANGATGNEANMLDYVFSKFLFFGSAIPMTQSETFMAFIILFRVHKNLGTQNTRKQKGDAPIDEAV
jgi:hypothetical protein